MWRSPTRQVVFPKDRQWGAPTLHPNCPVDCRRCKQRKTCRKLCPPLERWLSYNFKALHSVRTMQFLPSGFRGEFKGIEPVSYVDLQDRRDDRKRIRTRAWEYRVLDESALMAEQRGQPRPPSAPGPPPGHAPEPAPSAAPRLAERDPSHPAWASSHPAENQPLSRRPGGSAWSRRPYYGTISAFSGFRAASTPAGTASQSSSPDEAASQ